jgi:hypothetical protein
MQKGHQKHYALLFPTFVWRTFMAFRTINNSVQVQKVLLKRTKASRVYLELRTSPNPISHETAISAIQGSSFNIQRYYKTYYCPQSPYLPSASD